MTDPIINKHMKTFRVSERLSMKSKPIKFVVTEQFAGTATAAEIFTNLILSEMKEKGWNQEQQCGIMDSPTIPNHVVPEERSSHGT